MCEPTTIAAVSLGLTAVSTGVAMYSANQQEEAAAKAAEYEAQQAERNAKLAEEKAKETEQNGMNAESDLRKDILRVKAAQRASFANAGVLVDAGTAGDVTKDTQMAGDFDAMTLRRNASLEAQSYRSQAQDFLTQSKIARETKMPTRGLGPASSLLSGGSTLAKDYITYDKLKKGKQ